VERNTLDKIIRPVANCIGDGKLLSWDQYDTLKGSLILLIVIGHNTNLQSVWPNMDRMIYNFHVSSFLLIPQMLGAGAFTLVVMRDKAIRFMAPHVCFLTLASILYAINFDQGLTIADYVARWSDALLYSNSPKIVAAAGLQLYWFLPTLLCMTVIRAFYYNTNTYIALVLFFALAGTALFIGTMGSYYVKHLPWGLAIAAYMLCAGLLTVHLVNFLRRLNHHALVFCALALALAALTLASVYVTDSRLNLSVGRFFSIETPAKFFVHFALVITGMLTALYAARYLDILRVFRMFGRYSLVIFLSHSMIFYGINFVAPKLGVNLFNLAGGVFSLALTVLLSTLVAKVIADVSILRKLITTRGFSDWIPGRSVNKPHQA